MPDAALANQSFCKADKTTTLGSEKAPAGGYRTDVDKAGASRCGKSRLVSPQTRTPCGAATTTLLHAPSASSGSGPLLPEVFCWSRVILLALELAVTVQRATALVDAGRQH